MSLNGKERQFIWIQGDNPAVLGDPDEFMRNLVNTFFADKDPDTIDIFHADIIILNKSGQLRELLETV